MVKLLQFGKHDELFQIIPMFISFRPFIPTFCSGSEIFCEYISDDNNTMSDRLLWPAKYIEFGKRTETTFLDSANTFFNNTIIVRLRYKSSEVEFTKLDVRITTIDKVGW